MKKKNILSLIRYHAEKNEAGFRNEAYEIAKDFDQAGDSQLAEYIMSLLSNVNTFVPQMEDMQSAFFEKIEAKEGMLLLPDVITQDIIGIVNAIDHRVGINKFLFQGAPGTGKTEAVKQLARILGREIYMVDFSALIDSKLGQTQKNLVELFKEINQFMQPEKVIVLFDEIDALALDRTNQNDLREMGRVTSTLLKCFDRMNENIVLVATTNLYDHFDKAIIRRFDSIIDFNRYEREDLLIIAEKMLDEYLQKFKLASRDIRLFRKIINLYDPIPYPGDLKNVIRTSIAFSNPKDGTDYFRRLYYAVCNEKPENLKKLQAQNFTVREIEILTQKSKSSVARELKDGE
ncbi:ATP-binding protein [Anaerotignum lactatifermentans]|uniref:ATP-binding protein n=1 Tax=Anaerotignum lactatifermentans TaxID=160404 RepID=UPI0024B27CDD|nr:ATP-binding protein [Anaerotignum lactatifermentans]